MSRRYFRHGELPLVLLALLAERPMHGYELMAELSRLFGPAYRPSPGTVYPAVDALVAEGLLTGTNDESRTVFRTTATGDQALATRAALLAAVEVRTGARLGPGDSLEKLLARFTARLAPMSGHVDPVAVQDILDHAATRIEAINGRRSTKGGRR
ncbi:PadR family transcriptional regulator [Antrihabitans sp. NCIMB 15449]|uniref:PadR family transcriptional regulator n=1 Tax=Antrihabitans spumae TaxID=3373370 RepID=A0ABW7JR73_9NOCA